MCVCVFVCLCMCVCVLHFFFLEQKLLVLLFLWLHGVTQRNPTYPNLVRPLLLGHSSSLSYSFFVAIPNLFFSLLVLSSIPIIYNFDRIMITLFKLINIFNPCIPQKNGSLFSSPKYLSYQCNSFPSPKSYKK